MKTYFKVESIENLKNYRFFFNKTDKKTVLTDEINSKVIAKDLVSDMDVPGFTRSTMDGYAVKASDTFGATESNPLYLKIINSVKMGETPDFSLDTGQAAEISTGGMVPLNSDAVIMVEHTLKIAEDEIEIHRSVSKGTNLIDKDDDFKKDEVVLKKGTKITAKNTGVLAACGKKEILTYRVPIVGIISTGDEIIDIEKTPVNGEIRDLNRHMISSSITENNFKPVFLGHAKDNKKDLFEHIKKGCETTDIVIITGGSSVGTRDVTIDAINELNDSEILLHGLSMSPGKPAILARSGDTPIWGLPGHPASCFIVFHIAVLPFIKYLSGDNNPDFKDENLIRAKLTRNISSAPGRDEFVRVKLEKTDNQIYASPVLGESGLIRTLAFCDGLLKIPSNKEGGLKDEEFFVYILN